MYSGTIEQTRIHYFFLKKTELRTWKSATADKAGI